MLGAVSAAARPGTGAAIRDRIAALPSNRDELVVPVVWSEDSSIDGYYLPVSGSFTASPLFAVEGTGSFQVELRRFGGGSLPQCELYGLHAARTNSHSITNTTLNGSTDYVRVAVPSTSSEFWPGSASAGINRVTASGTLSTWYIDNVPLANTATYTVVPGDYYTGACEIRTTYGSATSQLVGGRYCPPAFDGMILSNGLVRVFLHPSIDTAFEVEVYDGSAWENLISGTGWRIEHDYGGGPTTQSWDLSNAKVSIIENSPVRSTIRLMLPEAASLGRFGRVWLDLSVRRGDPFICGTVRTDVAGLVALEPTTSTTSSALTGGMRASTTDLPEGNRALWGIANGSPSNNTTTGRITQTSGATTTPFMVGFELGGSGSSGIEQAQDVMYQWYDVKSESLRVVLR